MRDELTGVNVLLPAHSSVVVLVLGHEPNIEGFEVIQQWLGVHLGIPRDHFQSFGPRLRPAQRQHVPTRRREGL